MPSLAVKSSSTPTSEPLAPQGERRRRQLVEIASRLVAEEGIQAASLPRVAELAGVGRTAIYRYFTQREDLLAAVENEFFADLSQRIDRDDFSAGVLALGDAESASAAAPGPALRLLEALWDTLIDRGPAGLILRAHAPLNDPNSVESGASLRFSESLMALGLSALQADLIGDSANAMLTRLYVRAQRGEIERDEALQVGYRALTSLVRGFREDSSNSSNSSNSSDSSG